jgi:hypothetical protein
MMQQQIFFELGRTIAIVAYSNAGNISSGVNIPIFPKPSDRRGINGFYPLVFVHAAIYDVHFNRSLK